MCCKAVVMVEETRDMRDDDDEGRLPLLPAMGVGVGVVSFEAPPATEEVVVCM